jgi:uncharacterized protein YjbI with pentapeptide repeats
MMKLKERLMRWEGVVFGFILGIAATVVGSMVYNEVHSLLHVSHWKRLLHDGQVTDVAALMEAELEIATAAMEDGTPLELSRYLAFQYMPKLYAHQMAYSMTLLKNEDVAAFNDLRAKNPFLTLNLAQKDLSGLDLHGADFSGADLTGTSFRSCNLSNISFFMATMPRADLTDSKVSDTLFNRTDLSGAILTAIRGEGARFDEAVLVDASLVRLENLRLANFSKAEMAQANLWDSSFPEARFDGADLTLASAVDSNLTGVESMNDVNLTGANLAGALIDPERVARAWFVNTDGISPQTARGLRRHGGVERPEEVLQMVDDRIVSGFRAQIEEDDSIPALQREEVLLTMLKDYYLR